MMRLKVSNQLAVAGLLILSAQNALAQGRSITALPLMDRTAQSHALGDGGAYLQGLNSLGINPAGLYSAAPEILTQYQQLPLQTSLAQLGASTPLSRLNATLGLTYLNLRSTHYERRNEFGDLGGDFNISGQMFGLHISRPVGTDYPIFLGMSVKMLQFGIDSKSAAALAFDLGGRYRLSQWPVTLGVSVVNLGKGPVSEQAESKLPTSFIFSGAYHMSDALAALGSVTHNPNEGRSELTVGTEYWVGSLFALRGRYSAVKSEVSAGSGIHNLAMGLGFKILGRHTLDYSFQPFDSGLANAGAVGTHRMTLTMRFAGQGVANPGTFGKTALGRKGDGRKVSAGELKKSALEAVKNGQFALGAIRMQQALDLEPGNRQIKTFLPKIKGVSEIMPRADGAEESMALTRKGVMKYVEGDAQAALSLLRQAYSASDNSQIRDLVNYIEQAGGDRASNRELAGERNLAVVTQKLKAAKAAVYEGRHLAAVRSCEEALELAPRNARALEIMGSAYYLMGDRLKARQAWKQVLEIEPHNQATSDYLNRVL